MRSLGVKRLWEPLTPHCILNDPKQIPHGDENADNVEHQHESFPLKRAITSLVTRLLSKALVEDKRRNDEEAKYDYLQDEAKQDDLLAPGHFGLGVGPSKHAAAQGLSKKAEDIPSNKYFRHPIDSNDRVCFATCSAHDSTEDHVYGGGEENWCEENQEGLKNVWRKRLRAVVTCCSANIPNDLDS